MRKPHDFDNAAASAVCITSRVNGAAAASQDKHWRERERAKRMQSGHDPRERFKVHGNMKIAFSSYEKGNLKHIEVGETDLISHFWPYIKLIIKRGKQWLRFPPLQNFN